MNLLTPKWISDGSSLPEPESPTGFSRFLEAREGPSPTFFKKYSPKSARARIFMILGSPKLARAQILGPLIPDGPKPPEIAPHSTKKV